MRLPVALEAVLRAEERALDAQLQARRTLQRGAGAAVGRLANVACQRHILVMGCGLVYKAKATGF